MAEEAKDALADVLDTINRTILKGLATADQWTKLVNEYFVYAEDEEGHEEEEHAETEPPETEEEQQDPVEDEEEPLIIMIPWKRSYRRNGTSEKTLCKYPDQSGYRHLAFCLPVAEIELYQCKLVCNSDKAFWEHSAKVLILSGSAFKRVLPKV